MIFDVAIVGAGPAGSALAVHLARAGARVALVERATTRRFRVGESLPPAVAARLQRLGFWDDFLATGARASDHLQSSWGTQELQSQSFIGHPHQCGWQIDRARFDQMLQERAGTAGATLLAGCRLRALAPEARGGWRLELDRGRNEHLRAQWLVDATGRTARVAAHLGIEPHRIDALIGLALRFDGAPGDTSSGGALIEATRLGWWYSARLPDLTGLAIFMTDADFRGTTRNEMTQFALQSLAAAPHTARRLGGLAPRGAPTAWQSSSHVLKPAAGAGWLAIGDAAVARDPLSSSGIDFALASAELAARTLLAAHAGDSTACARYSQAIADDFAAYCTLRAGFYRLERRWPDAPFWARRLPAQVATT